MKRILIDSMERMEAIMLQAEPLVRGGRAANLVELKPLRLRMAGAMTSCQVALHDEPFDIGQTTLQGVKAEQCQAWDELAADFRQFALQQQSSTPPPWDVYAPTALALFKRIRRQILLTRRAFGPQYDISAMTVRTASIR